MPGGTTPGGTSPSAPTADAHAGSFGVTPKPQPLAGAMDTILVGTVTSITAVGPGGQVTTTSKIKAVANIRCTAISTREGAEPGTAEFRYVFDDTVSASDAPRRFDNVLPLDAQGAGVIKTDDRIVVARVLPKDGLEFLFDGHAQVPQLDLADNTETVTFRAPGRPCRCWDTPLPGAVYRHSDKAHEAKTNKKSNDAPTDRPCRFNPEGKANATPLDGETEVEVDAPGGKMKLKRPAFLSELIDGDPRPQRMWTLGMAVRYILLVGEPWDTKTVDYSDIHGQLDDILSAKVPKGSDTSFDPDNASTYDLKPILAPDIEFMDMPWPEAVERLIAPHGFGMRFNLSTTVDKKPLWSLRIYRKDSSKLKRTVKLQKVGAALDPSQSNLGSAKFARDSSRLANRFVADSKLTRFEVSVVLAPGFAIDGGDAARAKDFIEGSANYAKDDNAVRYREWIFGEAGDPWWDFKANSFSFPADLPDLSPVLKYDGIANAADGPKFARIPRPGIKKLLSLDSKGKPRVAELWVSADYTGPAPGLWIKELPKKKGQNWVRVTNGNWDLLKDELGIRLNMTDPNGWGIYAAGQQGGYPNAPPCINSGKLKMVTSTVAPDAANPRLYFRLTCVIEGDLGLKAIAEKRPASPTKYAITRRDDVRERYERGVVSQYAHTSTKPKDVDAIDETDQAKFHADQRRAAHETPRLAGTITIPKLSTAYPIGSVVSNIDGRNVSLRTNAGAAAKESPHYATIVGVDLALDGMQKTTFHLDDRRAEPFEPGKNH